MNPSRWTSLAAPLAAGLLALGLSTDAAATEIGTSRSFGLGLQLGDPVGLTGKFYLGGRTNAIDFVVGSHYYNNDYYYSNIALQAAFHWHLVELTSGGGVAIPFRIGVGGFFVAGDYYYNDHYDDFGLGARVPFGLDFDLEQAPVQFYVELAFDLVLFPYPGPYLDGGVGFRYYF